MAETNYAAIDETHEHQSFIVESLTGYLASARASRFNHEPISYDSTAYGTDTVSALVVGNVYRNMTDYTAQLPSFGNFEVRPSGSSNTNDVLHVYGAFPTSITNVSSAFGASDNAGFKMHLGYGESLPNTFVSFTGGDNEDAIELSVGWELQTGNTYNGGAGNDKVLVPVYGSIDTAAKAAKLSNFEYFGVIQAGLTANIQTIGLDTTNTPSGFFFPVDLAGTVTTTLTDTGQAARGKLIYHQTMDDATTFNDPVILDVELNNAHLQTKGSGIVLSGIITDTAATTLNIYSLGSGAHSITQAIVPSASGAAMNIFGTAPLSISAFSANVQSVNAAGMTAGGVTLSGLNGDGSVNSVVGSAGDDNFAFTSGTLTNGVTVNGSDGVDVIRLATGPEYSTANLASFTNFEGVDLGGEDYTFTLAMADAFRANNQLQKIVYTSDVAGAAALNLLSLPAETTSVDFDILAGVTFAEPLSIGTLASKSSFDINFNSKNKAYTGEINFNAVVTVNGIDNLNVNVGRQGATLQSQGHIINVNNVIVKGGGSFSYTSVTASESFNIDASELEGALTFDTPIYAAPRTIVGSESADTITLDAAATAITVIEPKGGDDTVTKATASTSNGMRYQISSKNDGGVPAGSNTGAVGGSNIALGDLLTGGGDNEFVSGVDKIQIVKELSTEILTQTGVTNGVSEFATGAGIDFTSAAGLNGILSCQAADDDADTDAEVRQAQTLIDSCGELTNVQVGDKRIFVIHDDEAAGEMFTVYFYEATQTSDEFVTEDLTMLLRSEAGLGAVFNPAADIELVAV